MHYHLPAYARKSGPGSISAGEQKLQAVEGKDMQPAVSGNSSVGKNCSLGLVRGLLRDKQNQRPIIALLPQVLNNGVYAKTGLARSASA